MQINDIHVIENRKCDYIANGEHCPGVVNRVTTGNNTTNVCQDFYFSNAPFLFQQMNERGTTKQLYPDQEWFS